VYIADQGEATMDKNIIRNNLQVGIYFNGELGGTATNNEIYGNKWGIYIAASAKPILSNNSIYNHEAADIEDKR
jgi:parallel beta-helix repeat protein